MKRLAASLLLVIACGGPAPSTLPIVGQVLGKVELPAGGLAYLIDLPTENRRCLTTYEGLDCWSTVVTQTTQP